MNINLTEPRSMSFHDLENEVYSLRKAVDAATSQRDSCQHECAMQKIQIDALRRTNYLAAQILQQAATNMEPSKAEWIRRTVTAMCQKIKDMVCDITEAAKDTVVNMFKGMYQVAMDICNFIYDHFGEIIIYTTLSLAAATIAFDVVLLGAYVFGTTMTAEAAAASGITSLFIDFAAINAAAGF